MEERRSLGFGSAQRSALGDAASRGQARALCRSLARSARAHGRVAGALASALLAACAPDAQDAPSAEVRQTQDSAPGEREDFFATAELGTSREIASLDELLPTPKPLEKANGTISCGSGCSSAQCATLQQQVSPLMMNALRSSQFLQCMNNGLMAFADGFDPENIAALLLRNVPTTIHCNGNGPSTAPGDVGQTYERISLSQSDFGRPSSHIARSVAHEIAHTKGFRHLSSSDEFSVPETVGNCVESVASGHAYPFIPHLDNINRTTLAQAHSNRELLPDEAITPPIGITLTNTQPVDVRCDPDMFATGVAVGEPGPTPRGFALACPAGGSTPSIGYGTTPQAAHCAPNEVLVGIASRSTLSVGQIAGLCARADDVWNKVRTVSRIIYPDPLMPAATHSRLCPAGMAVNGLIGLASNGTVSALRLQCQAADAPSTLGEWREPRSGALVSPSVTEVVKCEGRGALVGFQGLHANGRIHALGGHCFSIVSRGGFAERRRQDWLHAYAAPGVGRTSNVSGGTSFSSSNCATNAALVGVDLSINSSTSYLSGVRGVCANVAAWTGTAAAPTTSLTRQGGDGSTAQIRCLRGELLSGLDVSVTTINGVPTVTAARPICRNFRF